MSLTFTVDVGGANIGYVEIIRREKLDVEDLDRSYTYDWYVGVRQPGLSIRAQDVVRGVVSHRYSDGAWVLMQMVMSAFIRNSNGLWRPPLYAWRES